MPLRSRRVLLGTVAGHLAAASLVCGCTSAPGGAEAPTSRLTLRELSGLARDAYIYTLPLSLMHRTRAQALARGGAPNRFQHARALATPASRAVTAPNNDTLYSSAWLDLSGGPLVLHVPDTAGRYYDLAFMDFYSNNFAHVGRRTTGTGAGDFVVVGPGWQGRLPAGLPVIVSPTNAVWLLGRFLVHGNADLPAVHALQDQLSLTFPPGSGPAGVPERRLVAPRPGPAGAGAHFALVDAELRENPPPVRDRSMSDELAKLGLGTGASFDMRRLSAEQRAAVESGVATAKREINAAVTRRPAGRPGWTTPRADLGNFGTDYLFRAIVAQVGLGALDPREAMYLSSTGDADGRPTDGAHRYLLHFPRGGLPSVDAFWSLTMYQVEPDERRFLVPNPIDRYSVGDRTKGLVYNADGSLDIYIQHREPDRAHRANWLPAPAGPFVLSLRAYQPRSELLSGRYQVPVLQRQD